MIKCSFCENENEETLDICQDCLFWLEFNCIPGPDDAVTGHDREGALHLLDAIQQGKPVVPSCYDLIRKCIARGAEAQKCCCRGCKPHVPDLKTQMVAQSTQDILDTIRQTAASVGASEAAVLQAVTNLHNEKTIPGAAVPDCLRDFFDKKQ